MTAFGGDAPLHWLHTKTRYLHVTFTFTRNKEQKFFCCCNYEGEKDVKLYVYMWFLFAPKILIMTLVYDEGTMSLSYL